MVLIQSTTGLPATLGSGAFPSLRGDPQGALVTIDAGLQYVEPCRNGQLFTASTVNTGVSVASLTLTTTAPTAFNNPTGSNVNCYLKSLSMGYVSGTLGTGQFFLVGHPNATAPTGTAATYANSCLIGNTATAKGLVTYTSTVAASGKVIRNLSIETPFLATTVAIQSEIIWDFNGSIGIMPGSSVSFQGITTSATTPLCVWTWIWQENTLS